MKRSDVLVSNAFQQCEKIFVPLTLPAVFWFEHFRSNFCRDPL